ncbi:hypothetical protein K490DRAFT_19030, partial [Saccharata proteae CBS 121410]
SANLQALTDRALRFLSTASNETLGACLVGLGASTYLVLGRVGLILIGVVGGVVLHATWEGNTHVDDEQREEKERRRREAGIDVIQRILKTRSQDEAGEVMKDRQCELDLQLLSGKQLDYSGLRPETSSALNEFTDAVIRDYVKWWYSPILPGELGFPTSCRQTLTAFVLSVSNHLSRKRPADAFLEFLTNSSAIIIVFLNELSSAMAASPSSSPADAVQTYLDHKPESNLANVLDTKHQEKKLDGVAEDILQNFLESKTYNCKPARTFLREILAKVVLEMTIKSCSKPEWINGWIVYLLEEGEPELMKEIDAGVNGSAGQTLDQVKGQATTANENDDTESSEEEKKSQAVHRRVVSKAQEAMDDAMREAQRLTQMIQEEEAQKLRTKGTSSTDLSDMSESTTQGVATPTSSDSEQSEGRGRSQGKLNTAPAGEDPSTPAKERQSSLSENKSPATSFDQLVPANAPTALGGTPQSIAKAAPLTIYNAIISIYDDSVPGDKSTIRSKPIGDYLVQIEPASSQHPGWMIARKYADFETLHEVLRRISVISGTGFHEAHSKLPHWKGHTKTSLRGELERYLNDANRFQSLAESEGMKRFLEKDRAMTGSPLESSSGLGWPNPSAFANMGKGMMDALTKAPTNVATGGKTIFGGVTGVLGGVGSLGPRRTTSTATASTTNSNQSQSTVTSGTRHKRAESTVSELPQPSHMRSESTLSVLPPGRRSQDSLRSSPIVDTQPAPIPQMERRPSYNPDEANAKRPGSSSRSSVFGRSSREHSRAGSRAPSARESLDISPLMGGDQILNLPPLPTDIDDDYSSTGPASPPAPRYRQSEDSRRLSRASTAAASILSVSETNPTTTTNSPASKVRPPSIIENPTTAPPKPKAPLNEQETQMAVELFFAIINELYTLSSAWQIRKTLLGAAKTFLLRPGNPQLESIRVLLQDTVLDSTTSDEGIAAQLRKLRKNTLPTEEELRAWPEDMGPEEKERLRVKARRLLVERGMPQALTSVMGQAASGEALGRVFDCLQVERVARGFVFGILLQGVRAVTQ